MVVFLTSQSSILCSFLCAIKNMAKVQVKDWNLNETSRLVKLIWELFTHRDNS